MKKQILIIWLLGIVLMAHAQRTVPISSIEEDYYLNFWKRNLDSLTQSTDMPAAFQMSLIPKMSLGISGNHIEKLIGNLKKDIPMKYDPRVEEILDFYLQNGKRTAFALVYFKHLEPQIEAILKKNKLPNSLKYMPFALSAMNIKASGKTGASGLWQLMYAASKREGLIIDSYVDERRDLGKSTQAAASELAQLYELYANWELVIGAYACGPTNLNKTIRRMGNEMNYYTIYPNLPDFGRDIVPALTATAILCQFYADFNLNLPKINFGIEVDTLEVSQRLHFVQLNEVLHIAIDSLRYLNPQYKHDIVPAIHQMFPVLIPKGYLAQFNDFEDSIYHYKDSVLFNLKKPLIQLQPYKSPEVAKQEPKPQPPANSKTLLYYTIKSGDNLGRIASWYNVKQSQIQDWNNIRDPRKIQIGKKLKIYVPQEYESYYRQVNKLSLSAKQKRVGKNPQSNSKEGNSQSHASEKSNNSPSSANTEWRYYTVKAGESPYSIAKKFQGISAEDILRWNNIKDPRSIWVGQKLKIKKQ